MGQNKEVKNANKKLNTEYDRVGKQYDTHFDSRNKLADESRQRSNAVFDKTFAGYDDFIQNSKPSGFGNNNAARQGYERYSRGGGVTDENKARIRGGGVFDEFARTGGVSEADKTNIRARGTATIPSFYANLKQELDRTKAAQGGYSPGYSAQAAELSRDAAFGAQDAALNAEGSIIDRVSEGRKWGASSMSGAERALVDAIQNGEMFGISGMADLDKFDSQSSAQHQGQLLQALQGMRGLRTDTPGEVGMYEDVLQNTMQGGASNRRGLLQDKMAYNPNKSFIERAKPWLDAAVGVGSAFLPGGQAAKGFGNFGAKPDPRFYNDYMGGLR